MQSFLLFYFLLDGTAYAQTLQEIKADDKERQKKLDEVLAKKKMRVQELASQHDQPSASGAQSARSSKRGSLKNSSNSGKGKRSSAPSVDTSLGGKCGRNHPMLGHRSKNYCIAGFYTVRKKGNEIKAPHKAPSAASTTGKRSSAPSVDMSLGGTEYM